MQEFTAFRPMRRWSAALLGVCVLSGCGDPHGPPSQPTSAGPVEAPRLLAGSARRVDPQGAIQPLSHLWVELSTQGRVLGATHSDAQGRFRFRLTAPLAGPFRLRLLSACGHEATPARVVDASGQPYAHAQEFLPGEPVELRVQDPRVGRAFAAQATLVRSLAALHRADPRRLPRLEALWSPAQAPAASELDPRSGIIRLGVAPDPAALKPLVTRFLRLAYGLDPGDPAAGEAARGDLALQQAWLDATLGWK